MERNTGMVALAPALLSFASFCRLGPVRGFSDDCDRVVVGKTMGPSLFPSIRRWVRYLLRRCLLSRGLSLRPRFELQHPIGSIATYTHDCDVGHLVQAIGL